MVNNFDQIEKLLKFEKKDDCYYVQLLRRQSDDPMIDGKPDPAYHGNMHSRSLKDYLISSIEQFRDLKKEMITLCDTFNVRAYIRLNKRNYKNISTKMLKQIADQVDSGETYCSPYHLIASAIGSTCQAGKAKTWILDLDAEYLPHKDIIYQIILQCEPVKTMWEEYVKNYADMPEGGWVNGFIQQHFTEIQTKHGIHIISRTFNKQAFAMAWNKYCVENHVTAPLPQVKVDTEKGVSHWSLTDKYLKHASHFAYILQSCGVTATIDKVDKNKTIIHSGICDQHALEDAWHAYCLENTFWMKQPDMHKDNPTILYVP